MHKLLLAVSLGLLVSAGVGCITPAYSGDPDRRTQQLLFTSENLRAAVDDVGAGLVPGSAGPHDAVSYPRRHPLSRGTRPFDGGARFGVSLARIST